MREGKKTFTDRLLLEPVSGPVLFLFYVAVLLAICMAVIVAGLLWQQDFLVAIGVGISAGGAITSALTRRAKGDVPWLIGIAFSLAGLALVAWQVVGS